MKLNRIIISGGGTGGHIFPALAIADEISRRYNASILFVGAEGRMEMERIPKAGYKIVGLPVRGLKRSLSFSNFGVLLDFVKSSLKAKKIIKEFKPDLVIGVGGYASAPVLRAASGMRIPCLIQEQNSYAGVTNKMLAKKVKKICVAYSNMQKYFPVERIVLTGNPVRNFKLSSILKEKGKVVFNFNSADPVLLAVGGSLGAGTVNNAMLKGIDKLKEANVQVIWQTGKYYYEKLKSQIVLENYPNLRLLDFIGDMEMAYNVADLVISRAGALSISEICLLGIPSILVPSPNVAEDHQTKNAMALVNVGATKMVRDAEANSRLVNEALNLLANKEELENIGKRAGVLGMPKATQTIVDIAESII